MNQRWEVKQLVWIERNSGSLRFKSSTQMYCERDGCICKWFLVCMRACISGQIKTPGRIAVSRTVKKAWVSALNIFMYLQISRKPLLSLSQL